VAAKERREERERGQKLRKDCGVDESVQTTTIIMGNKGNTCVKWLKI